MAVTTLAPHVGAPHDVPSPGDPHDTRRSAAKDALLRKGAIAMQKVCRGRKARRWVVPLVERRYMERIMPSGFRVQVRELRDAIRCSAAPSHCAWAVGRVQPGSPK